MNRDDAKVDLCSIERATSHAKDLHRYYLDRADKIKTDAESKYRHEVSECVICYAPYGASRVGGTVSTSCKCAFCDTMLHSGTTNIDVLCVQCAKENHLCKHCGGDVDLKFRRKKRKFQTGTP